MTEDSKKIEAKLNIDAADQSLWLVKVPHFVAEQWANSKSGSILGKLSVKNKVGSGGGSTGSAPVKEFGIRLEGGKIDDMIPQDYALSKLNKNELATESMLAFSARGDGQPGFIIDGKITKSMVLRPKSIDEYRSLIRQRSSISLERKKKVPVIISMADMQNASMISHTVDFIVSDKPSLKRKANELKNSSRKEIDEKEEQEMRKIMLEAFENEDRYQFKDLVAYCSGKLGTIRHELLRTLLKTHANIIAQGQFKNFYELKAQYRDNTKKVSSEVLP
jgi:hypothetical protein